MPVASVGVTGGDGISRVSGSGVRASGVRAFGVRASGVRASSVRASSVRASSVRDSRFRGFRITNCAVRVWILVTNSRPGAFSGITVTVIPA
ncbi:hypothetical protein ACSAZL_00090 [Methanosarcina sp. T3]|uniref:hypothetical protein n=1 Tax=Methanosarcina sp. T3 TaxID=3439062 RepID=UPI003F83ECE8